MTTHKFKTGDLVRILAGGEYDEVICTICAGDDGPDTYEWDKGIVP